jgi:hypothetical protein
MASPASASVLEQLAARLAMTTPSDPRLNPN